MPGCTVGPQFIPTPPGLRSLLPWMPRPSVWGCPSSPRWSNCKETQAPADKESMLIVGPCASRCQSPQGSDGPGVLRPPALGGEGRTELGALPPRAERRQPAPTSTQLPLVHTLCPGHGLGDPSHDALPIPSRSPGPAWGSMQELGREPKQAASASQPGPAGGCILLGSGPGTGSWPHLPNLLSWPLLPGTFSVLEQSRGPVWSEHPWIRPRS